MKNILVILIFIFGVSSLNAGRLGARDKISLKATFPEGFGILIKRDFLLLKANLNPDAKGGGVERIYIIVNGASQSSLLKLEASKETRAKLDKAFGDKRLLKITAVGDETIVCTGGPGISKDVRDLEEDGFTIPGGYGWHVGKIFRLQAFRIGAGPWIGIRKL